MCCAEFIAKYVLFIFNLLFSLLGLVIIGLGIAVLVSIKDIQEILPVNVITISLIVLGAVVFLIGFLACCGAIRESRCMLICYAIFVGILLAAFIYLTAVVMGSLFTITETVDRWVVSAFDKENLRVAFNVMEGLFRCCGTVGAASYTSINQSIPPSCCAAPVDGACAADSSFRGCAVGVGEWLEGISGAVGGVLIAIILVQTIAMVFALFLTHSIGAANKRRRQAY